jgi:hypothetical protein
MAHRYTFWAANDNRSEGARQYSALCFLPSLLRCRFIEEASSYAMASAAHRRRPP